MQVNSATQSAAATGTTPKTKGTSDGLTDPLAQKSMFLKLLVAQMKYQDPTQPTDSMQYIQQLSQYSQLEQMLDLNTELKNLHADIDAALKPAADPASGSN